MPESNQSAAPSGGLSRAARQFAASIGPGIFIIGYIIGTGSVTAMAASGAKYGLSLTWALGLSCLFTYVMTVSISRTTIISGQTLIYCIRRRFGMAAALLIIVGLSLTIITSIMGVMGIATDVVREWTRPLTTDGAGIPPVLTAFVFTGLLYGLFWMGSHDLFLKVMAVVVGVMGTCFIVTMFLVIPEPAEVARGFVPGIPSGGNPHLILAGMVGTTMATVCLVTRSYLVAEKGWTLEDLAVENRDAMISLSLTFLVSVAIMACAAGTMHVKGIEVERAIDMVRTLDPLAGRFATSVFVVGIIAAALSSLFPNFVLGPWVYCDLTDRPRRMDRGPVRLAVLIVALAGFVVPLFGGRPVPLMIASQALSPIVMPLLIIFVFLLLNDRRHGASYKNPLWLNIGLLTTLAFSLFVSYTAIVGLLGFLSES